MKRMLDTFTGAAMLALAMLPAAAIATAAHAEPAMIRTSDLDLNTQAGQQQLKDRIELAARAVCRDEQATGSHLRDQQCLQGVREEFQAKLKAKESVAKNATATAR